MSSNSRSTSEANVELLTDPQAWIAFLTLTALELVLGIDNIVFISILVDRLPPKKREFMRRLGLGLAMFMRIALLLTLAWLVSLTAPLFVVLREEISGRDLILLLGGLFLIWKATGEIHDLMEGDDEHGERRMASTFGGILLQIIIIDLVFSLDSIITAIGMAQDIEIMVAAVVIACIVMYVSSGPVSRFVAEHPTTKMLALAFLVLIGVALVADGFKFHIPRGYIYFAMLFAAAVELFNVLARRNRRKAAR
jgi:predicted tellurium resistance membrane protein TerC